MPGTAGEFVASLLKFDGLERKDMTQDFFLVLKG